MSVGTSHLPANTRTWRHIAIGFAGGSPGAVLSPRDRARDHLLAVPRRTAPGMEVVCHIILAHTSRSPVTGRSIDDAPVDILLHYTIARPGRRWASIPRAAQFFDGSRLCRASAPRPWPGGELTASALAFSKQPSEYPIRRGQFGWPAGWVRRRWRCRVAPDVRAASWTPFSATVVLPYSVLFWGCRISMLRVPPIWVPPGLTSREFNRAVRAINFSQPRARVAVDLLPNRCGRSPSFAACSPMSARIAAPVSRPCSSRVL